MTFLIVALVVCLTMICLVCLGVTALMIWWTMDSAGRHSISAGKQTTLAVEALKESTGQQATVVGMVTNLSEMLLLGRPTPPTLQSLEMPSEPETLLTPDDLWRGLPETVRENLIREAEEAGTWPSHSEMLQPGSDPE